MLRCDSTNKTSQQTKQLFPSLHWNRHFKTNKSVHGWQCGWFPQQMLSGFPRESLEFDKPPTWCSPFIHAAVVSLLPLYPSPLFSLPLSSLPSLLVPGLNLLSIPFLLPSCPGLRKPFEANELLKSCKQLHYVDWGKNMGVGRWSAKGMQGISPGLHWVIWNRRIKGWGRDTVEKAKRRVKTGGERIHENFLIDDGKPFNNWMSLGNCIALNIGSGNLT